MSQNRWNRRIRAGAVLVLLAAAAASLAACGRAGPPEPPPGPIFGSYPTAAVAAPPPPPPALGPSAPPGSTEDVRQRQYAKAEKNGFDAHGNPVAPSGDKRWFFLDFLMQ